MGPASDPMAVVSQYGRVHGLEGLWVAAAFIMPDSIRANTNATTIMIGGGWRIVSKRGGRLPPAELKESKWRNG
jgi:choline dehydrogenase-like flavoprotein